MNGRPKPVRVNFAASFLAILPLALTTPSVAADTGASQGNDFQLWSEVQANASVTRTTEASAAFMYRQGDDLHRGIFQRGQLFINYRPKRFLQLSSGYGNYASHPSPGSDIRENRFMLESTIFWTRPRFTLGFRDRFERRILPTSTYNRFRHRVQLDVPLGGNGKKTRLFASGEIQYDAHQDSWSRNRFILGIATALSRRYTVDTYYLYQIDTRVAPRIINAVGVALRIRLRG